MSLGSFFKKQFVDVIQWTESGDGVLAYRYPMQDMEIQYGAQLTVRESQMALFVNEGKVADAFGPGLHTLETRTLPLLTNLMNWDKAFQSPFKSDVYFFSTRMQIDQRWGTQNPITIRDKDFGMVRLRGHGIYAYHLVNPLIFHQRVSGTRDIYASTFAELGLQLDTFVVQNLSLPDELQRRLDERIGMNMVGNLRDYTQFQVAQSIPTAAANEGGAAGVGAGLGAGMAMGKAMADAITGGQSTMGSAAPSPETKFCAECGKSMPRASKFCPECGKAQG